MVLAEAVYVQIAKRVCQKGQGMTRAEVARQFNIGKGTAIIHLEKAVERGLIIKAYTFTTGHYRGWVYMAPGSVQTFLESVS